ncbi:hypothetical protein ACOSQ4_008220 [Xanthoceras sorbifolium]
MQAVKEFDSFTLDFRPRLHCIAMNKKIADDEYINVEAVLTDKKLINSNMSDRIISFGAEISKEDSSDVFRFAFLGGLEHFGEIYSAYEISRDKELDCPFTGPCIRHYKIPWTIEEFLRERGLNEELFAFMDRNLRKKEKIQLNNWLQDVRSYFAKP